MTITQLPIPTIMWSQEGAFHTPIEMLESINNDNSTVKNPITTWYITDNLLFVIIIQYIT